MAHTRKNKSSTHRKTVRRNSNRIEYPPDSIKSHIAHVVYINLDSRKDRKEHTIKQLKVFGPNRVHRIPGVVDKTRPLLGSVKAHLHALQLAQRNGWENALIMEDDCKWNNTKKSYPVFEMLVKKPYDVIMLSGTYSEFDKKTYKVHSSYSASAYLVHKHYYTTLINKTKEVLRNYKPGMKSEDLAQDAGVFGPLQAADSWYIVSPSLCIQINGHSNIQQGHIEYNKSAFA